MAIGHRSSVSREITVNYQLSTINYQLSTINCQLPLTAIKLNTNRVAVQKEPIANMNDRPK
ncbi:MAG: hypothetical protein HC894_21690, partial [Microcoleus sp. SM1_3_4]|nr:hypothetical protein [Microcoleus sp. SM1_3_4]